MCHEAANPKLLYICNFWLNWIEFSPKLCVLIFVVVFTDQYHTAFSDNNAPNSHYIFWVFEQMLMRDFTCEYTVSLLCFLLAFRNRSLSIDLPGWIESNFSSLWFRCQIAEIPVTSNLVWVEMVRLGNSHLIFSIFALTQPLDIIYTPSYAHPFQLRTNPNAWFG